MLSLLIGDRHTGVVRPTCNSWHASRSGKTFNFLRGNHASKHLTCGSCFFPKQELLGSSPQKKKERAWWHAAQELGARGVRSWGCRAWMGGTALGSGAGGPRFWMAGTWRGLRSLDGWHAALELGARGVWMGGTRLRSWGPAEFGWVARGSGARIWMGGTRLRSWGPAEFGWVARGSGAGGPRFGWHVAGPAELDGWHAALELGARGIWMGGTRLMHWDLAPQHWRFEPTYTVDKHFEQAQTYTNTRTHIHACSEPNLVL